MMKRQIDLNKHYELQTAGYLHINQHPEADLLIHNYSPKAAYEHYWTPETLMSRGLITDLEGRIVARPFPKFFNLGERDEALPNEPFEVFEKLDGSLGILYFWEGQPFIATRGSFNSSQSRKANAILREQYATERFERHLTYLFEIIYPENRVVVHYGAREELILLGMIETDSGTELPLEAFEGEMPVAKRYPDFQSLEEVLAVQEDNREGFVVRFQSGYRIKVKMEEYVRLHRIMTGVTPLKIWDLLKTGASLDVYLQNVPEEFENWVRGTAAELQAEFDTVEQAARLEFKVLGSRAETAAYFKSCQHTPILFKMLDGKDYAPLIWRLIRPSGDEEIDTERTNTE